MRALTGDKAGRAADIERVPAVGDRLLTTSDGVLTNAERHVHE